MTNDPRLDPEMAAFNAMMDKVAQGYPTPRLALPFDEARAITEAVNIPLAQGGPVMAESRDAWLPVRGRRIQCRVHRPVTDRPLPVLLYLHGGGWVWNSIDTNDRMMREYAAATGCAVVGPDYALSPEAVFPQALEECLGVLRWLAAHGAEWGLDPTRIIVGGDSAGANLTMGVALMARDSGDAIPLRGLLLNYGVYDSRMDTPSYKEFAEGYGLNIPRMSFYWQHYAPDAATRLHPFAAPLRAKLEGLPPCAMYVAELDVLRSENDAMEAALRSAGVEVESELFPGTVHGFLRALAHVGAAQRAMEQASAWMKRKFA